jgi:hypothetical protein
VRDELLAAHGLIELAERPRKPGARRRKRLESERREQPSGADVPRVRHHEQLAGGMECPETSAAIGDGHLGHYRGGR